MSILINKNSRVVVQGITGSEGQFHSQQMVKYGTNIVIRGKDESILDEALVSLSELFKVSFDDS